MNQDEYVRQDDERPYVPNTGDNEQQAADEQSFGSDTESITNQVDVLPPLAPQSSPKVSRIAKITFIVGLTIYSLLHMGGCIFFFLQSTSSGLVFLGPIVGAIVASVGLLKSWKTIVGVGVGVMCTMAMYIMLVLSIAGYTYSGLRGLLIALSIILSASLTGIWPAAFYLAKYQTDKPDIHDIIPQMRKSQVVVSTRNYAYLVALWLLVYAIACAIVPLVGAIEFIVLLPALVCGLVGIVMRWRSLVAVPVGALPVFLVITVVQIIATIVQLYQRPTSGQLNVTMVILYFVMDMFALVCTLVCGVYVVFMKPNLLGASLVEPASL